MLVSCRIYYQNMLYFAVQTLRMVQKKDRNGKDVMWCFAEYSTVQQAASTMKVLQVGLLHSF